MIAAAAGSGINIWLIEGGSISFGAHSDSLSSVSMAARFTSISSSPINSNIKAAGQVLQPSKGPPSTTGNSRLSGTTQSATNSPNAGLINSKLSTDPNSSLPTNTLDSGSEGALFIELIKVLLHTGVRSYFHDSDIDDIDFRFSQANYLNLVGLGSSLLAIWIVWAPAAQPHQTALKPVETYRAIESITATTDIDLIEGSSPTIDLPSPTSATLAATILPTVTDILKDWQDMYDSAADADPMIVVTETKLVTVTKTVTKTIAIPMRTFYSK